MGEINNKQIDGRSNLIIGPLSVYEKLDIETNNFTDLPYTLQGDTNSNCSKITYTGTFHLLEKTANSYFIQRENVYNFNDNNDKAIGGAHVR